MSSTSKPKHTIADKGSMKALQRFIQIEMKKSMIMVSNVLFFNKYASNIDVCKELNMQWIGYEKTQTKWSGCMDYSK